jgi:hypothetical protein
MLSGLFVLGSFPCIPLPECVSVPAFTRYFFPGSGAAEGSTAGPPGRIGFAAACILNISSLAVSSGLNRADLGFWLGKVCAPEDTDKKPAKKAINRKIRVDFLITGSFILC